MELQEMTKAQLIEKVEELSTNLDSNICRNNELGAKVLELEKIENELRAENDSLKKENIDLKGSVENYRGWWQSESKKLEKIKESLKAASIVFRAITYEAIN